MEVASLHVPHEERTGSFTLWRERPVVRQDAHGRALQPGCPVAPVIPRLAAMDKGPFSQEPM